MIEQVDKAWLKANPLPAIGLGLDKEDRGRVLVVGGSVLVPGAAAITGEAALRAGAGKVQIGTPEETASMIGVATPEFAVIALPTDEEGELSEAAGGRLRRHASDCDTLVLGPGMTCRPHTADLVRELVGALPAVATTLLDAGAISALRDCGALLRDREAGSIITPHHGELASLLDIEKDQVAGDPAAAALRAATEFGAIVVLKAAGTFIADGAGGTMRYSSVAPGLGTAGSGDVLAGVIGGLLARGAEPWAAAGWGVWLHGEAGRMAGEEVGTLGYLATEVMRLIPRALDRARDLVE